MHVILVMRSCERALRLASLWMVLAVVDGPGGGHISRIHELILKLGRIISVFVKIPCKSRRTRPGGVTVFYLIVCMSAGTFDPVLTLGYFSKAIFL